MCESRVFLASAEGEQLLLDDVTVIRPDGDGFLLVNLFGERTRVSGRLREIDLLKHRVVFEPESPGPGGSQ